MSCYTSNQVLEVDNLQETSTSYVSFESTSPITISFRHSGGSVGTIAISPTGPTIDQNNHSVTFGSAHEGTEYTISVNYTDDASLKTRNEDTHTPLETPVKKPVFKPVGTCPP